MQVLVSDTARRDDGSGAWRLSGVSRPAAGATAAATAGATASTAVKAAAMARQELQRRLMRLLAVGVFFMLVYALSNHLTSLRTDIGDGVFEWERAVPFVPWTIVPYLSIVALFVASFFVGADDPAGVDRHVAQLVLALAISVLCYAAFPLRFTFERPLVEGVLGGLFAALSAFDLPYNRAPSLHIIVLVILWARLVPSVRGLLRIALCGWLALIGMSVFTTWQHHLIDVIAGGLVGGACIVATRRPWPAFSMRRVFKGETA